MAVPTCPRCSRPLLPDELQHTMCRRCAEVEIALALGAGVLDLPADWWPEEETEA